MYLFYSFTLSVLFVLLLPYFAYQSFRYGKYWNSFFERMGRLPESLRSDSRPALWIHAVSVGEFLAALPLIAALREAFPAWRLVVSTTTMTGQRLARSRQEGQFDAVCFFPFDWGFSVRRVLDYVKPSVVIILETELWPNFLRECRRRNIVTVVANGRISPRSFKRYRLLGGFMRRVLNDLSLLVMQSEADASRARDLGAGEVRVCGNLKYDVRLDESSAAEELARQIDSQFALAMSPHLIVAGSTAPGEESMLLRSLIKIRQQPGLCGTRLLIAPRHPERFEEVAELIARSPLTQARRSQAVAAAAGAAGSDNSVVREGKADVILLDSIGELAAVYRFASVVFVGGSLVPKGGHNIIEPAAYAKPVIVGPYTENFRQIISDFARAAAVIQATELTLTDALTRLLADADVARALGAKARQLLLANRGAAECTVATIRELLP
jgi:3-deoxy-D-manno-octulosonic-acid transferase